MVRIVNIIKKTTLLSVVMLFCMGCPEPIPEKDSFIKITNNSMEDIIWVFYLYRTGDLNESNSPWDNVDKYRITAGNSYLDKFNSESVQKLLTEGWVKYYIFNYDSIKTIPWNRIRDERIILKEVAFNSWEEMKACGFTITYP